jgi:cyanophycin synthetase
MNILKIRTVSGPNYWSVEHCKLVEIALEGSPVYLENGSGFWEGRLSAAFPELPVIPHFKEERITDAGVLLKVISLLINQVGSSCNFQKIERCPEENLTQLVFEFEQETAGILLATKALEITNSIIAEENICVAPIVTEICNAVQREKLGPSTYSIYAEAKRRGIPVMRLDDQSLLQLGYGALQKRVEATITTRTNTIAVDIAGDKHRAKQILEDAYLPVPKGTVIENAEELESATTEIGFPIVVKPLDGNQGRGITTNISDIQQAREAFTRAKEISKKVIIEKFVTGKDFRILVINNKLVAAAFRSPAAVTGDGNKTIAELIEQENKDPRRGNGHENVLTKITVDADTMDMLAKKNFDLDSIPAAGETVLLKSTANLSTGGTAEDVTDKVHPANVRIFERTARTVGLDICGIDVMAQSLSNPITENGGAIIEVNAAPGIRMHLAPSSGQARNVAKEIVDMLFGHENNGRIPIIAITGTNGKTTTTRLVARMATQHGYNTGFTTTDGIYINNELLHKGDCSGPQSAKFILKDSSVEFAVLETARGGILRSGLGFDECDCAVITNVAEDHLGLNGIHTLEQLAKVKSVVAKAVREDGWVVLNADDDLVYAMKDEVKGKVALFSLHPESSRIQEHCAAGGTAAICDEGFIMIRQGNSLLPVEEIENVPLTYGGKAKFNVANALGATMAAWLMRISMPAIRCSLRTFRNSADTTPGRLNVFDFGDFTVLMDYAHNPHGLRALGEFIHSIPASRRVGVVAAVGDRRNEDILGVGEVAGRIFDDVIIRMDEDLRGRTEFELCALLRTGIQRTAPDKTVYYFSNETEAVEYAVQSALPGSLVVLLVENIRVVCDKITELKEMRKSNSVTKMKIAS